MRIKEHISKRIKESKKKKGAKGKKMHKQIPTSGDNKKKYKDGFMGVEIKIER